jgi:hypothetical protein
VAVTVSLYNHTSKLFAEGSLNYTDTYQVILCTAVTFDATNTTLAGVTYTEVANGNGYTTGGQSLANVTVGTVTTNDASFDADDVTWTASGGSIIASYALLYNDTIAGDPPLALVDFGQIEEAGDGTDFKIVWNANGIFQFVVA